MTELLEEPIRSVMKERLDHMLKTFKGNTPGSYRIVCRDTQLRSFAKVAAIGECCDSSHGVNDKNTRTRTAHLDCFSCFDQSLTHTEETMAVAGWEGGTAEYGWWSRGALRVAT